MRSASRVLDADAETETADFALQTVAIGAEAEIRVRGYEGEVEILGIS